MRFLLLFSAVMLSAAMVAAEDAAEAPTDEMLIRGTWELMSKTAADANGVALPEGAALQVTFEDGTWRAKVGPEGAPIEASGSFTLDSKQTPKLIDVTLQSDNNSHSILSIYKFEKDQLHFRLPGADGQRPADFEVAAPQCITLVFRRAPK